MAGLLMSKIDKSLLGQRGAGRFSAQHKHAHEQYPYQWVGEDGNVLILLMPSKAYRVAAKCKDCGITKLKSLAPAFEEKTRKAGPNVVILCWDCYEKREGSYLTKYVERS